MGKTIRHYLREAIDYYKLGQYDEALIACENAILLDPQFARAYHGKGLILVKQEKYNEAFESYQRAYQLDPRNAKLIIDRAKLLNFFYERDRQNTPSPPPPFDVSSVHTADCRCYICMG